jgi:ABC-type transport system involved in cytochrome bd biosynthesis fused ATPase/permease subunit
LLGGTFLTRDKAVSLLPFLFFLTFLAIFYIANTYLAEKTIREIAKVKKEVKEFRYEYITTKSELMFYSKQTQVAKSLESTGIKESTKPPQKIIIETN